MAKVIEQRFFPIEMRADGEGAAPKLVGYAAVFNELSLMLYGMFRERIERGAFAGSLTGDVKALWNHDTNLPLGRTKAGTLALAEDAHGLRVEINPPDTQAGRDAVTSIQRGDVDQMSFAFEVLDDTWDQDAETGVLIRTLRKVVLHEVSPVVFPAYPATSVSARAEPGALGDMPIIPEQFRRTATGLSAEQEQALLAVRRRRLAFLERVNY